LFLKKECFKTTRKPKLLTNQLWQKEHLHSCCILLFQFVEWFEYRCHTKTLKSVESFSFPLEVISLSDKALVFLNGIYFPRSKVRKRRVKIYDIYVMYNSFLSIFELTFKMESHEKESSIAYRIDSFVVIVLR